MCTVFENQVSCYGYACSQVSIDYHKVYFVELTLVDICWTESCGLKKLGASGMVVEILMDQNGMKGKLDS